MSLRKRLAALAALVLPLAMLGPVGSASAADHAPRFPADSGVVFLGAAPYNVKCDGVTDNTAALNTALAANDNPSTSDSLNRYNFRTLVLPAGVCLVSNTVGAPGSRIRLVGAGQFATTLKLKDNAAGYGSASTPKYLYKPGNQNANDNTGYANYLQDLTLDVGNGNPGAVGLRWAACNTGAAERVTIRGGTGTNTSGLRGLTLESGTGPSQVQDVTIEGFGVGIWTDGLAVNNTVFTGTTLRNQRTLAIQNNGKNIQFEGLTVSGAPKVYTGTAQAAIQVIDSTLTGPGSGAAFDVGTGWFYGRNLTATGFTNLVTQAGTPRLVGQTSLVEWATAPYRRGNTSVPWSADGSVLVSLNLPHPRTPENTNYDLTTFRRAAVTAATTDDDGPALQAAIDSGARVVYVPHGAYTIKTPVIVRGNVEKIDFMGARVDFANTGRISVGAGVPPVVHLQNASAAITFEQNSSRTMVVENMGPIGTKPGKITTGASATGPIFLENYAASNRFEITRPVDVFIRQSNREGQPSTISGGARVWIFGDNLEMHDDRGNPYLTITGSTVEILAGAMDNLATGGRFNSTTGTAHYAATNSRLSVVVPGVYRGTAITGHALSDTVNGVRVGDVTNANLLVGAAVGEWKRTVLPLYVSP